MTRQPFFCSKIDIPLAYRRKARNVEKDFWTYWCFVVQLSPWFEEIPQVVLSWFLFLTPPVNKVKGDGSKGCHKCFLLQRKCKNAYKNRSIVNTLYDRVKIMCSYLRCIFCSHTFLSSYVYSFNWGSSQL